MEKCKDYACKYYAATFVVSMVLRKYNKMMTLSKVRVDTIDFKGLFLPPLLKRCENDGLKYDFTEPLGLASSIGCFNSSEVCCHLKSVHLK